MIYYVILAGGEELHVPILRENVQDKCQLQEAHESSQVRTIVKKEVFGELCTHTYIQYIDVK